MRSEVARDLSDSAYDFLRVGWPVIGSWFGGGDLRPVEAVQAEEFAKDIDVLAGIDAWQIDRNRGGIRGIASRVQWMQAGMPPYDSFTSRFSRPSGVATEWDKRLLGLKEPFEGWIFPALTAQIYVQEPRRQGPLLYACAMFTIDLYTFARDYPNLLDRKSNGDGTTFNAIWIPDLKATQRKVEVYRAPNVWPRSPRQRRLF